MEALEVGAEAKRSQLPAPDAGAVITVRTAVDAASHDGRSCDASRSLPHSVLRQPAATATDRNDRPLHRLGDALYALAYLRLGRSRRCRTGSHRRLPRPLRRRGDDLHPAPAVETVGRSRPTGERGVRGPLRPGPAAFRDAGLSGCNE